MTRLIILLIVIVVTSVSAWFLKIKLKRKMERGLGRKVDDGELTSITAWMKVPPEDMPDPRDKNPHV